MQSSSVGDDQDIDMTSSQFGESNADSDDEDCDDREVYNPIEIPRPRPNNQVIWNFYDMICFCERKLVFDVSPSRLCFGWSWVIFKEI